MKEPLTILLRIASYTRWGFELDMVDAQLWMLKIKTYILSKTGRNLRFSTFNIVI